MRNIIIIVLILFGIVTSNAASLLQNSPELESSEWVAIFWDELERHLENEIISDETREIIENIIVEHLYVESPEIAAFHIYKTAIKIEMQLRKGIILNRIRIEARRRLSFYNGELELPLFIEEGSRSRTGRDFINKESQNNSSTFGKRANSGNNNNEHQGFNKNK